MFSGKTSKLLEIYKQCVFCDIPVVIINHSLDIRYHDTMVSSHDKIMAPCIQTTAINNIWSAQYSEIENSDAYAKIQKADVVLINEAQFFNDLYTGVASMLDAGKKVYVCGLDGDFQRQKFGQICELIPLCDKITKLTSLCGLCKNGNIGIFSMRLTNDKEQTLIGSNNYIPVCRKCYKTSQSI